LFEELFLASLKLAIDQIARAVPTTWAFLGVAAGRGAANGTNPNRLQLFRLWWIPTFLEAAGTIGVSDDEKAQRWIPAFRAFGWTERLESFWVTFWCGLAPHASELKRKMVFWAQSILKTML
jgi:hypothetical protein